MLDRCFKLKENGVTVKSEALAGLTTFAAMAYILAVNPAILSNAGMPVPALITVTALAAAIGCFLMAALTNFPIAQAPGMGTNSYFAFVICIGAGLSWQTALSLTFWNGVLFLLLSVTGLRKRLAEALPNGIKVGIQCGIGFFIAFLGLKSVGIVVGNDATLVTIGDLKSPVSLLVLGGVALMTFLTLKRVAGALLITILSVTLVGLFITINGEAITTVPDGLFSLPSGIGETFFKLDLLYPLTHFTEIADVLLTLLILDLFDSIGTLVGLSRRAKLVNADGSMPKMGRALTADSIATITGALLGTSTTTSYIESAAGIESGGRTGLTSVTTGICFLIALFLTPIILVVPAAATAPALVMVGIFMAQGLKELNFDDLGEVAPAFITMLMIPLTFSITEGIGLGLTLFTVIMLLSGRARSVPLLSHIITLVFIIYYAFK
ncbi:NCS2 family permease [Pelagicoccus sp. SDUM812003]|uniref:NCS2 family permease n=1 Tax=Pelagicoccus sp. SDUM812003 TaxID=3041267 RepID=UPI00280EEFA7|nr:NCS2 family permease [Pelagicoccus sp. SDUM812003]